MEAGLETDNASDSDGPSRRRNGDVLSGAFKRFVFKDDVVALSKPVIHTERWSFTLLGGFSGLFWSETTEGCIRLSMPPGQEKVFAYVLLELSDLASSESLGLTKPPPGVRVSPENALSLINLGNKKVLTIPVKTRWSGSSAKDVLIRQWLIAPDSTVCSKASKK